MAGKYSFKDHSIVFGTQELTGIHSDGIDIAFNGEGIVPTVGADGEHAFNIDADQSATVTVNLLQSSSSNEYLSGIYNTAKQGGQLEFPLIIRDQFGKSIYSSSSAAIKRIPDTTRAKEIGAVGWEIVCGQLEGIEGGSN
jgi:C4-type Zn-finger protein